MAKYKVKQRISYKDSAISMPYLFLEK